MENTVIGQSSTWPMINRGQLEAVISEGGEGLVDLWEASPVRLENNASHTEQVVDVLFPGNPRQIDGDAVYRAQPDDSAPLLAIADLAGGEWPHTARTALVELYGSGEGDSESNGIKLLAAIREIFNERKANKISTEDLIKALIERENDEPWATWWEKDFKAGNIRGLGAKLTSISRLKPNAFFHRASFSVSSSDPCPLAPFAAFACI
jgi:hypothetical protein